MELRLRDTRTRTQAAADFLRLSRRSLAFSHIRIIVTPQRFAIYGRRFCDLKPAWLFENRLRLAFGRSRFSSTESASGLPPLSSFDPALPLRRQSSVNGLTDPSRGLFSQVMGKAISPRGDMPKNRVPLFSKRTRLCRQSTRSFLKS